MLLTNAEQSKLIINQLCSFGLETDLLRNFGMKGKRSVHYEMCKVPPHRDATSWLKNRYSIALADRVLRLYNTLYDDIENPKPMTAEQVAEITRVYIAKYPKDDMSANRIYFLIQSIKAGFAGDMDALCIEKECKTCKKEYVVSSIRTRNCAACNILQNEKSSSDKSFVRFSNSTRVKEGTNFMLKGVKVVNRHKAKIAGVR